MTNKIKTADPFKTKTGKTRLGPLNLSQLEKLLDSARKKNRPKILRRIAVLKSKISVKLQDQGDTNVTS